MENHPLRYSKLKKVLESYGLNVGDANGKGGKGSEAKITDPNRTRGIKRIKKHGKNPEITKTEIYYIRKKFQLDPEHGVSDEDFYSRS